MEEELWRFHQGTWSRMSPQMEFYDEEGEPLDAPAGYSAYTRTFGDPGEFEVEVYSADPEAEVEPPSPYLVMVYNVGNAIERILVDDFPSLLQLLRDMAPILDLPNRGWEPEDEIGEDGEEE